MNGYSFRKIASEVNSDPATVRRALVFGEFPKRDAARAETLRNALQGVNHSGAGKLSSPDKKSIVRDCTGVQIDKKEAPRRDNAGEPRSAVKTTEEIQMLIQRPSLSPKAREAFSLPRDVFLAPGAREEVFLHGEARLVYEHMLAKARHGGLLAVVGESGAGKSTLKDLLVSDLAAEGEIIVIEPHIQRMEESDKTGKSLKSGDIVEAIMTEVAPATRLRRTAEAQLRQCAVALAESAAASKARRHILIIEEAHSLPKPTLRHLKRFLELKNPAVKGLQRPLLSILLIGQPELADRLSPADPSVREVWQRCEVVALPPLGKALDGYVAFRLGSAAGVFDPAAVAELGRLLTARDGRSYAYPLAVDNWLAIILNSSAGIGQKITAAHVTEAHAEALKKLRGGR